MVETIIVERDDPYKELAMAMLTQAIEDLDCVRRYEERSMGGKIKELRPFRISELRQAYATARTFLRKYNKTFQLFCSVAGIDPNWLLGKIQWKFEG